MKTDRTIHLIQKNIPLYNKNWFHTGGAARFFAAPTDQQEFKHALTYAGTNDLNLLLLGNGANMVISDDGFDGLVIRPALKKIEAEQCDGKQVLVHAGSGVSMPTLIAWCLDNNIIGLEEFSGIPGTMGGALYNNMHYFQFELSDFLVGGRIINKNTQNIEDVDAAWFNLGYDQSKLQEKNHYLLRATFKLNKANDLQIAHARGRSTEIVRHRTARYPATYTCGSFFKNFAPEDVTKTISGTNKKMIYVAYYLDKLGVKGELCIGGAAVSHKHANMIINMGEGTSTDIIAVAHTMQKMVYENFNIIPQPECELVGFKNYPLMKNLST